MLQAQQHGVDTAHMRFKAGRVRCGNKVDLSFDEVLARAYVAQAFSERS